MITLKTVKAITNFLVTIAVGEVVGNAVKATTPIGTRGLKKLAVGIGSLVLSSMAVEAATNYIDKKFDKGIAEVTKMVEENKQEEKQTAEV